MHPLSPIRPGHWLQPEKSQGPSRGAALRIGRAIDALSEITRGQGIEPRVFRAVRANELHLISTNRPLSATFYFEISCLTYLYNLHLPPTSDV